MIWIEMSREELHGAENGDIPKVILGQCLQITITLNLL